MPVTIKIEKVLEDWWATDEQFATMDDKEIIELVAEDHTALLTDVVIFVERAGAAQK